MTCDEIIRVLPEYLIGELPVWTTGAVRDHMASCPSCSSRFARMQSVARRISARPIRALPDSYFSRFPGEVMKKIGESTSPLQAQRHSRHIHRALMASAAAAAAALLIFFIWPAEWVIGPGYASRPGAPTESAVATNPSDEELANGIASLDLSGADDTLDLLYGAQPWEALPDISDGEWDELLGELSQESSG